jgi:hypothetical protein
VVTGASGDGPHLTPSKDSCEIADQVLDFAVPRLADGGAVFVLDRMLTGGGADSGDVIARRLATRFTDDGSGDVPSTAFPVWGVVKFPAGSPDARCVHRAEPVAFAQMDSRFVQRAGKTRQDVFARLNYRSFLAVPMIVAGGPNGLISFKRTAIRPAFDDDEIAMATALAGQAGLLLADTDQMLNLQAMHLQQASPGPLPSPGAVPAPGLEVAGRCLPSAGNFSGGDWYDVVSLPAGRTGVIVGDVMGHGRDAAALMAQLRSAAYRLACSGMQPAELLRQLAQTATELGDIVYATCAYTIIDPARGSATIALAGHPPPVLAWPDGVTRVPGVPPGLSLGLGNAVFGQVRIKLPPGTVLALFTDGLVETRARSYDSGIRALRTILARQHRTLNEACNEIISSLAPDLEDDTTVVLIRIPAGGPPRLTRRNAGTP